MNLFSCWFGHSDHPFRERREVSNGTYITVLVCPDCGSVRPFDATFQKAVIRGPQHQQSEARGVPKIKATSKKIKSISAARASQRS